MARQTDKKWYSNGLKAEEALKLEKKYAKIEGPVYGLKDGDFVALQFSLRFEHSRECDYHLAETEDIEQLFFRTKTTKVAQLEGKVIEAFLEGKLLRGISVNPNFV